MRLDIQTFFISIGARYKRIRKRPRGAPSPQLYEYKVEKLQKLESQASEGRTRLYYADESHTCTEGYVPYGWQLQGENVYVPSQRVARLNIFGMIDRDNRYNGFTTFEKMTADKVLSFLDDFSFNLEMDTFVVLDNASVHRNKKIKELRPIWEQRGLFLFFLPPYSPQLNIAETLWRILKGKWISYEIYIVQGATIALLVRYRHIEQFQPIAGMCITLILTFIVAYILQSVSKYFMQKCNLI